MAKIQIRVFLNCLNKLVPFFFMERKYINNQGRFRLLELRLRGGIGLLAGGVDLLTDFCTFGFGGAALLAGDFDVLTLLDDLELLLDGGFASVFGGVCETRVLGFFLPVFVSSASAVAFLLRVERVGTGICFLAVFFFVFFF